MVYRPGAFVVILNVWLAWAQAVQAAPDVMAVPDPMAVPGDDLANLAVLAPPAMRSTRRASYGDAAFLRDPQNSSPRPVGPAPLAARSVCRAARHGAACAPRRRDGSAFFKRNYVFTPSFVSAPQIFEKSPGRPSLLPPVTSFFFDPLDPPAERR